MGTADGHAWNACWEWRAPAGCGVDGDLDRRVPKEGMSRGHLRPGANAHAVLLLQASRNATIKEARRTSSRCSSSGACVGIQGCDVFARMVAGGIALVPSNEESSLASINAATCSHTSGVVSKSDAT